MANSGSNPKNTSRIILIVAAILVLTSLAYFATQYFSANKSRMEAQVEIEELNGEIHDLEERILEFDLLLGDKDVELKTKDEELQSAQDRLARLQTQINQARAQSEENKEKLSDFERRLAISTQLVQKYEQEMAILRAENEMLTGQVDSLMVNENELRGENRSLTQQRDRAQQELDETREIASILKIQDLRIYNYNSKKDKGTEGAEFKRGGVRPMRDLKVCFTLMENPLADAGQRDIYLVFENPDGTINTNVQSGQFTFGRRTRDYTAATPVDYRNLAEEVCITFIRPEDFEYQRGPQYLSLYADGSLIGQGSFMIK